MTNFANRGRSLESVVIDSMLGYGVIVIEKMGAEAKWVKPRNAKAMPIVTRGPVDFVGTVSGSGRSICFDAKATEAVRGFNTRSYLEPHQEAYLVRHGEVGAVSGILIESTHRQRFYWAEWSVVRDYFARSDRGGSVIVWDTMLDLGPTTHAIRFDKIPGVQEAPCPKTLISQSS